MQKRIGGIGAGGKVASRSWSARVEALEHRRVSRNTGVRGLLKLWTRAGKFRPVHWARKMIVRARPP